MWPYHLPAQKMVLRFWSQQMKLQLEKKPFHWRRELTKPLTVPQLFSMFWLPNGQGRRCPWGKAEISLLIRWDSTWMFALHMYHLLSMFSYPKAMMEESTECEPVPMDGQDALFVIYTSGTTGEPIGVIHSQAGYLLNAAIDHKVWLVLCMHIRTCIWFTWTCTQYVFGYQEGDVFACVADLGWITGHNYVVYGPLCNGGTTVLFEGTATFPDEGKNHILHTSGRWTPVGERRWKGCKFPISLINFYHKSSFLLIWLIVRSI